MTIINHIDYGFPLIVVDDFYNQSELDGIWEELNFYTYEHKFLSPDETGGANQFKKITKKNRGIWISSLYDNLEFSNIYCCSRKIHHHWSTIVDGGDDKYKWFWKNYNTHAESILLSYYENSDYYEPHRDEGSVTILNWIYKEPKKFEGGDLFFMQDSKKRIEIKNNRTIIFPSIVLHAVNQVKMSEEHLGKRLGRYCITQFCLNQTPRISHKECGMFRV